jgi:hypothetical protein
MNNYYTVKLTFSKTRMNKFNWEEQILQHPKHLECSKTYFGLQFNRKYYWAKMTPRKKKTLNSFELAEMRRKYRFRIKFFVN